MGLEWRDADRSPPGRSDVGVYRIGERGHEPLDYLGQGLIAARGSAHATSWLTDLAAEGSAERPDRMWDWVGLDLTARQLLEVENDLIASHVHVFARPPRVQFGGGSSYSIG